ncbi:hypothetical protein [Cohnella luojiensis]|uniref:LSM domain-containing protein n=1 Tax=Cohnella luojiensis TaxID=652876 RepID=A0A4Y8LTU7_9BACL|nr:hypothetical protein [Cohnella luojiensis]TFE19521.1 hypothetical protein E2980_23100 [Cohnella luojiensis]
MMDSVSFDENSLRPLYGRAVCVIMDDETRYTGILTSCGPSSLVLNGERTRRPVKRSRKSKIKAEVSTTQQEEQTASASSAYWGTLSLGPSMEVSTVKAVLPLAPVKAVFVI